MKTTLLFLSVFLSFSLFVSCEKDESPQSDPIVATWQLYSIGNQQGQVTTESTAIGTAIECVFNNYFDVKYDFSVDAGSYAGQSPCSDTATLTENKYVITLNSDNNYSFQSNIDPDDTFVLNLDGDYLRSIPVNNDDFIVTYKRQ